MGKVGIPRKSGTHSFLLRDEVDVDIIYYYDSLLYFYRYHTQVSLDFGNDWRSVTGCRPGLLTLTLVGDVGQVVLWRPGERVRVCVCGGGGASRMLTRQLVLELTEVLRSTQCWWGGGWPSHFFATRVGEGGGAKAPGTCPPPRGTWNPQVLISN